MAFKDLEKHLKDVQEDKLLKEQKEAITNIDKELPKFLEEIDMDFPYLLSGVMNVLRLTYWVDLGFKRTVGILIENDKLPFILFQGDCANWGVVEYRKGFEVGNIYWPLRGSWHICTDSTSKTTEELMEWLVDAPNVLRD